MPIKINDQINQAARKFLTTYGIQPNTIYLGFEEYRDLKEWAHCFGVCVETNNSTEGEQLLGLSLYRVSEISHLAVGLILKPGKCQHTDVDKKNETAAWEIGDITLGTQKGRLHLIFKDIMNVSIPIESIIYHAGSQIDVMEALNSHLASFTGKNKTEILRIR